MPLLTDRRGNAAFRQGRYKEAVAAYSNALELQPAAASVWLNRSFAHSRLPGVSAAAQAQDDARQVGGFAPVMMTMTMMTMMMMIPYAPAI